MHRVCTFRRFDSLAGAVARSSSLCMCILCVFSFFNVFTLKKKQIEYKFTCSRVVLSAIEKRQTVRTFRWLILFFKRKTLKIKLRIGSNDPFFDRYIYMFIYLNHWNSGNPHTHTLLSPAPSADKENLFENLMWSLLIFSHTLFACYRWFRRWTRVNDRHHVTIHQKKTIEAHLQWLFLERFLFVKLSFDRLFFSPLPPPNRTSCT